MPDIRASAERATALLLERPPRVGRTRLGVVDGPSGSGKTTFAQLWAESVRARGTSVALFSSDLLATWTDPFGWFDRFDDQVLGPVARGRPGRIQLTDWTGDEPGPGDWRDIPVTDVLILEGVSSARTGIGGRTSVMVWVEIADRAERLERAVGRDGEPSRRFLSAWQDDEDAFFAADRTCSRADLVIGGPTTARRANERPLDGRVLTGRAPRGGTL